MDYNLDEFYRFEIFVTLIAIICGPIFGKLVDWAISRFAKWKRARFVDKINTVNVDLKSLYDQKMYDKAKFQAYLVQVETAREIVNSHCEEHESAIGEMRFKRCRKLLDRADGFITKATNEYFDGNVSESQLATLKKASELIEFVSRRINTCFV